MLRLEPKTANAQHHREQGTAMKPRYRKASRELALALVVFAGYSWGADPPPASGRDATVEKISSVSVLPRIPPLNSALALPEKKIVHALRGGGYVLYLRHTETGSVSTDCMQSNLTERGRTDAVRLGQFVKTLRIPIGSVVSSDVCRVIETVKLMDVGPITVNEDLHRMPKRPDHRIHEARLKLIGTPPPAGTNTLLAGHMQNGEKPEHRLFLDMGEIVVFKPRTDGQADVVARIRQEDWPALLEFKTDPAGTHPAKP